MGAGADPVQFIFPDLVDHEPVRFQMRLAVAFPDPPQRMVTISLGQLFPLDQRCQQQPQLRQILALCLAPCMSRLNRDDRTGTNTSDVEIPEQIFRGVEAFPLAPLWCLHGRDCHRIGDLHGEG